MIAVREDLYFEQYHAEAHYDQKQNIECLESSIMRSELELSSDILQPIPLDEWRLLQSLLKVDWPKYSAYYYWIKNSTKWKKQNPNLALEIYSPKGKYQDDVTFVGISSFSTYDVVIFTKDSSGKRLHKALMETNRLDWSREVVFSGVDEYIQPILLSVLADLQTNRGIEIREEIPSRFYIKSADDCANVEIKIPKECYLGDLNPSHLPIIHSLWQYADKEEPENSMKLIRAMITLNKSIGLFLKNSDILVSWALHNEWHGLGIVQTLESYRRRGYAKIVVNALAKRLGEDGTSPIIAVTSGNIASENMFASLNWKLTNSSVWIIMKKQLPSLN